MSVLAVLPSGTKEWRLEGRLHREDGPAVESANGDKVWWQHGCRHREHGPAVEGADGYKEWWRHGLLHREGGPAIELVDGTKEWYLDDSYHREDGPAVEHANGSQEWWVHGKRHREHGPAVVGADGHQEWWTNDHRLYGFEGAGAPQPAAADHLIVPERRMRESYIDIETRSIVTISPSTNTPNKWWVNRVSVHKEHRGNKIAAKLVTEMCGDADLNGVTLRAYVSPDMSGEGLDFEQLRQFYGRYGFVDKPEAPGDMTRHPVLSSELS